MRKDAATIQSMFAEIAPRYDLLNRLLSAGTDVRWRRRTVRDLYRVRREEPWRIPTEELYVLMRAGEVVPPEVFLAVVAAADEVGMFTVVHGQKDRNDRPLGGEFQRRLTEIFERLDELIDIAPVQPGDITTGNPSLSRQLEGLRRDLGLRSDEALHLIHAMLQEARETTLSHCPHCGEQIHKE